MKKTLFKKTLIVMTLISMLLLNGAWVANAASGVVIKKIGQTDVPAMLPEVLPNTMEPLENIKSPANSDLIPAKLGFSPPKKLKPGEPRQAYELILVLNKNLEKIKATGKISSPTDWNGLELFQLAVQIRDLADKQSVITGNKDTKKVVIYLTDEVLRLSAHRAPDVRLRANTYKNLAYIYAKLGCFKRAISVQERIIALEPKNMVLYKDIDVLYSKISSSEIKVFVNGDHPVLDAKPVLENGKTIVPAGIITPLLNIKNQWDPSTRTVTFSKDQRLIKLTVNKNTALVNGKEVPLGFTTRLSNGRIMVPLKFLALKTGTLAQWLPLSKTIVIVGK